MLNIGDEVKIVRSMYMGNELQPGKTGKVGTVIIHAPDYIVYGVEMDSGYTPSFGDEQGGLWHFNAECLELVQ